RASDSTKHSRASPRIFYRTVEGLGFDEALEGLASNFLPNSRGPRIRRSTRGPRREFFTEQSRASNSTKHLRASPLISHPTVCVSTFDLGLEGLVSIFPP